MLVIYTFRLFYVYPLREETREGLVKRGKEERINYIFNLHLNPRRGENVLIICHCNSLYVLEEGK